MDAASGRESPLTEDVGYSSNGEAVKDWKQIAIQTDLAETQEIGTDAPTPVLPEEGVKDDQEEVEKPLVLQDVKETQVICILFPSLHVSSAFHLTIKTAMHFYIILRLLLTPSTLTERKKLPKAGEEKVLVLK